MFSQKREKFGVKADFFVVRFLISNVAKHDGNDGSADAKGSVALLPGEFMACVVSPPRGVRFDCENGVCQCQCCRKLNEEMKVVFRPADGVNIDSYFFADARNVGP